MGAHASSGALVPARRGGQFGGALAAGSTVSGMGFTGALGRPRGPAELLHTARLFPDQGQAIELLQLLRKATGKPRAFFSSPFQAGACYHAVGGTHEVAIIVPTGASACLLWWGGGRGGAGVRNGCASIAPTVFFFFG